MRRRHGWSLQHPELGEMTTALAGPPKMFLLEPGPSRNLSRGQTKLQESSCRTRSKGAEGDRI